MDVTDSSNGPLAAAEAWNAAQANAFRRGEIRSEIVRRSFEEWWEAEGDTLAFRKLMNCDGDSRAAAKTAAGVAWLTATLQCEEAARAELQGDIARLTGGAK
jgi:hypothetical protein